MSPPQVTGVQIETVVFPPTAKPTGTDKPFFLGGAGERGLEIEGRFIKFTAIGVYLEESAVPSLAVKWKGKSAEELTESVEFFRDIVSGRKPNIHTSGHAGNCHHQLGSTTTRPSPTVAKPSSPYKLLLGLDEGGEVRVGSHKIHGGCIRDLVVTMRSCSGGILGGNGLWQLEGEEVGRKSWYVVVGGASCLLAVTCKGGGRSALAVGSPGLQVSRNTKNGPFEKFTQVTMILPLTGKQYSEKVTENCVAYWKAVGIYTDAEAKAVEKFIEAFKEETFPPGASIMFTQSPHGSLTISFSKDCSVPETGSAVIENKHLSEAVLESIIGKHGVSPAAKQSLAARMSELLKECNNEAPETVKPQTETAAPKEISV
ncbi:chalcone-flavanone isomerase family protein [Actinidia rufa]|uniref:Chalcone-flavonone isomerase family protein n=1 Tax=Actinidia rufa TaxID=165716 RepID=A0A7J0EG63_9ERIC|nr:chalcone-flavanone isomerase family protein [Actinidia rufa]